MVISVLVIALHTTAQRELDSAFSFWRSPNIILGLGLIHLAKVTKQATNLRPGTNERLEPVRPFQSMYYQTHDLHLIVALFYTLNF